MTEEELPTEIDREEIEAKIDLHVDFVDSTSVGAIHVADLWLEARDRRVHREAKYEKTDNKMYLRDTYVHEGEEIARYDWVEAASVDEESCSIVDADTSWSGDSLEEVITHYIRAIYLGGPELELGEIFNEQMRMSTEDLSN